MRTREETYDEIYRNVDQGPDAFCAPPDLPEDPYGFDTHDYLDDYFHDFDPLAACQDLGSYKATIADSALTGEWEAALEVLRDMKYYGIPPDVACYALALMACKRGEAWERAVDLLEEMWDKDLDPSAVCYTTVIAACLHAGATEKSDALRREMEEIDFAAAAVDRFHTTPMMKWNRQLRRCGCSVANMHDWKGGLPVPFAPEKPCWFLPNQDDIAIQVASYQRELRRAGWKVISVDPDVVAMLGNKAELRKHLGRLDMEDVMPKHFTSPMNATYPCILKPAIGTFGRDTFVVRSPEQVLEKTAGMPLQPKWVLQELIPGRIEYSTTMLVVEGEVLDVIGTKYEYDGEEYVWPNVEEVKHEYCSVPEEHVEIFSRILSNFSGICCVGYKFRADGSMGFFEVNPRIGGDLVFDAPKPRARALFEKLDSMLS